MKTKSNAEIAAEANRMFASSLDMIRADESRTPEWRKAQIARVHRQVAAEATRLVQERDRGLGQKRRELEHRLFGPGTTSGDPASLAISRRDAGDRAASLKTEAEAAELLSRAERSNDEPLTRAILERAYEMDWVDVANQFLEVRPYLSIPLHDLWDVRPPSFAQELMDGFALEGKPEELAGLSHFEVEQLARAAEGDAVPDTFEPASDGAPGDRVVAELFG